MTGLITGYVCQMLLESDILPVEQNGCRKRSRGTKDRFLIGKMILNDSKRRQKNLAMAWVDYKKAYDMVPHSWIVECLQLAQVPQNVTTFLERSMVNWQTELTSSCTSLVNVNIRRRIFQGDSLSPLIFVICMIPLSKVLLKAKAGYLLAM